MFDRLRKQGQNKNQKIKGVEKGIVRFSTTFPTEMENTLVERIKKQENMFLK